MRKHRKPKANKGGEDMEEVKRKRKPRHKLTLISEPGTGSPAEMWSKLAKIVLGRDVKFVDKEVCK